MGGSWNSMAPNTFSLSPFYWMTFPIWSWEDFSSYKSISEEGKKEGNTALLPEYVTEDDVLKYFCKYFSLNFSNPGHLSLLDSIILFLIYKLEKDHQDSKHLIILKK